MRLADPGRPEEDDILAALDEAELGQVKSKSRSCFTAGSRLERIAACKRRLLRN